MTLLEAARFLQPSSALRNLKITHPEKLYYPEAEVKKIDLIEYLSKVADRLLPHLAHRPLMIARYPEGLDGPGFFQKHWVKGLPSAVKKHKVPDHSEPLMGVESVEGILALAQIGTLEFHPWNARFDHLEHPDQWIFDLDPGPGVPWKRIAAAAFELRHRLQRLDLVSFVKTTGGRGLHVVVPIKAKLGWNLSARFAKALCEEIAESDPDLYLTTASKAKRKGKIFLDYLRNVRGATAVAPYSPRASPNATISRPILWTQLEDTHSDTYDVRNGAWALSPDPWAHFFELVQTPQCNQ